jgi:exopolysaccharide biosynthesis polyprenyl glycosylphosphotransferase
MYQQQFYIIANILMLLDGLICIFTGYSAYALSMELRKSGLIMSWNHFLGSALFVMFANNFLMGQFGFYSEKRFSSYWAMIGTLFLVGFLNFVLLSTGAFLIRIRPFSRVFVVSYFFMALTAFVITRVLLYAYLDRRAPTAFNSRQILLIGTDDRMRVVAEALEKQPSWGHLIVGYLKVDGDCTQHFKGISALGNLADFDHVLFEHGIDEVIFALPSGSALDLEKYLVKCEKIGIPVRVVPATFDFSRPNIKVENIQGVPTLSYYSHGTVSASGLLYKRVLDVVVGFVGFLFFFVLYPIVGFAIKLDSPGPVLFKQPRVGRNGRIFNLYKFRSMVADAESRKGELLQMSQMNGPIFKMEDDPRITRVGRFLRKTSLDEFPQFINIVKGEMSLVGTRPPTPDEVEQYEDWHRRRISHKPGLTGLWQVSGRNKITEFSEVVKLDLQYIDSWRFWRDLEIIWKTVWVVLARKGAG